MIGGATLAAWAAVAISLGTLAWMMHVGSVDRRKRLLEIEEAELKQDELDRQRANDNREREARFNQMVLDTSNKVVGQLQTRIDIIESENKMLRERIAALEHVERENKQLRERVTSLECDLKVANERIATMQKRMDELGDSGGCK